MDSGADRTSDRVLGRHWTNGYVSEQTLEQITGQTTEQTLQQTTGQTPGSVPAALTTAIAALPDVPLHPAVVSVVSDKPHVLRPLRLLRLFHLMRLLHLLYLLHDRPNLSLPRASFASCGICDPSVHCNPSVHCHHRAVGAVAYSAVALIRQDTSRTMRHRSLNGYCCRTGQGNYSEAIANMAQLPWMQQLPLVYDHHRLIRLLMRTPAPYLRHIPFY